MASPARPLCVVRRPSRPTAAQSAANRQLIWVTSSPVTSSACAGDSAACSRRTASAQPPTKRRTLAQSPSECALERRTVTMTSSQPARSTSPQQSAATSLWRRAPWNTSATIAPSTRQREGERRAAAGAGALGPDAAAVRLDEPLRDGEPEAVARLRAPSRRSVLAEQVRQRLGRHAAALVGDRDGDVRVLAHGGDGGRPGGRRGGRRAGEGGSRRGAGVRGDAEPGGDERVHAGLRDVGRYGAGGCGLHGGERDALVPDGRHDADGRGGGARRRA